MYLSFSLSSFVYFGSSQRKNKERKQRWRHVQWGENEMEKQTNQCSSLNFFTFICLLRSSYNKKTKKRPKHVIRYALESWSTFAM